jgi:hypothetical protein
MFSVLIVHAEDKDGYMYKVKNNSKWKTFEVGCPINHKFYHMGIVDFNTYSTGLLARL